MKILTLKGQALQGIYNRNLGITKKTLTEKVGKIIEDVRINGDEAVIKYTKRFDKAKLRPRQLKVTEAEISSAFQNILKLKIVFTSLNVTNNNIIKI